jgi:hypothetical protein
MGLLLIRVKRVRSSSHLQGGGVKGEEAGRSRHIVR